jgi:hypothetical protein
MRHLYRSIMDSDRNPLRTLAPIRRFQIMVLLSLMWTCIFCAAAGLWFWYGEILAGHLLVALGVLITGLTFRTASQSQSYRDYPDSDGTARYDDVWGA